MVIGVDPIRDCNRATPEKGTDESSSAMENPRFSEEFTSEQNKVRESPKNRPADAR